MAISAGLLMIDQSEELEFFLVHPGGPFFKNKDNGFWTIPKGLVHESETMLDAAIREFKEETGLTPQGPYHELGNVKQKSGKIVHAWMFAGQWDPNQDIKCNTFKLEWPPRSGRMQDFPEVDRAAWMPYTEAKVKMNKEQQVFLERAKALLKT